MPPPTASIAGWSHGIYIEQGSRDWMKQPDITPSAPLPDIKSHLLSSANQLLCYMLVLGIDSPAILPRQDNSWDLYLVDNREKARYKKVIRSETNTPLTIPHLLLREAEWVLAQRETYWHHSSHSTRRCTLEPFLSPSQSNPWLIICLFSYCCLAPSMLPPSKWIFIKICKPQKMGF